MTTPQQKRDWYLANKVRVLARQKKWAEDNPERTKASKLAWFVANREKANKGRRESYNKNIVKERMRNRRKRWALRGLDVAAAEFMLLKHGGTCNVCEKDKPGGVGGWHVDHDHATGAVRGVLCSLCNLLLGRVERVGLKRIVNYLQRESARIAMKAEVNPLAILT